MSIHFIASLSRSPGRKLIKLPIEASELLPSRGMVVVNGMVNKVPFTGLLEPDGRGSHWFEMEDSLYENAGLSMDAPISFEIEPAAKWPEPEMPKDIMDAFEQAGLLSEWNQVTTKAHWEWLRFIRSTENPVTRAKRIDVACSKLQKGDRRPCCFDTSRCTVPELAKSGKLMIDQDS